MFLGVWDSCVKENPDRQCFITTAFSTVLEVVSLEEPHIFPYARHCICCQSMYCLFVSTPRLSFHEPEYRLALLYVTIGRNSPSILTIHDIAETGVLSR